MNSNNDSLPETETSDDQPIELRFLPIPPLEIIPLNSNDRLRQALFRLRQPIDLFQTIDIAPTMRPSYEDFFALASSLPQTFFNYDNGQQRPQWRPEFQRNWQWAPQQSPSQWWANLVRTSQLAVHSESLNATRLQNYPDVEINDEFICGISHDIMDNPVYDPAFPQQKYDLLIIRQWLEQHSTNPLTRTPLLTENLVYDEPLKERIDNFVNQTVASHSSSFQSGL